MYNRNGKLIDGEWYSETEVKKNRMKTLETLKDITYKLKKDAYSILQYLISLIDLNIRDCK